MTKFRPCIDLHEGRVKQIVGGTLRDDGHELETNFESDRPAAYYADLYRKDGLKGGHVIKLGSGNDEAAREALAAYPGGLQIGGGITLENASEWLDAGASHVIVTSWLFDGDALVRERLEQLARAVGRDHLVVDLSCRRVGQGWRVVTNRWQTVTNLEVRAKTLSDLAGYCDEFLVHAADVEGKCQGIDEELVQLLGDWGELPITYAGGANSIDDLQRVHSLSKGLVDLTIGSALNIFGGSRITYAACVAWNHQEDEPVL